MGKILYSEQTILDAKSVVDSCNTAIINAMTKIETELDTMRQVLDTPNANKGVALYDEYVNQKLRYIKMMKDNYNDTFNIINNEYHLYSDIVKETVGGNNG